MGLRNREPEPLRNGRQSSSGSYWNRGISAHGCAAFRRAYRLLLAPVLIGLGFSLNLAHIEKDILGVWCVYCVISLGTISLLTLLVFGTMLSQWLRRRPVAPEAG